LAEQVKDLKKKRAEEKNLSEKKALESEYNTVVAQQKMLSDRLAQLKSYHKNEDAQLVEMILNRAKLKDLDEAGDAMAQAADARDPAFDELRVVTQDPNFQSSDHAALLEANQIYRDQFTRSSERVIRNERIYPNEPEVTELSQAELAALLKLLDAARKLIEEDALALATAAHQQANKQWMEFITVRKNALPPVPVAPADPDKDLNGRLARLEPQVLDLEARGHPRAA